MSHEQQHVIRPQIVVRLRYMCFFLTMGVGYILFLWSGILTDVFSYISNGVCVKVGHSTISGISHIFRREFVKIISIIQAGRFAALV